MFERYTEGARRVVFFARYEASNFGSPSIDTEHLLLGLLREDKALIRRTLLKVDLESAHQQMAARIKPGAKPIPTSVDLPLSEDAKRALKYSMEEADRLNHRHIGTAHLLLGLLRDKQFASANFLSQSGAGLESLRKKLEALGEPAAFARVPAPIAHHHLITGPEVIAIHGVKRSVEELRIEINRLKEFHWQSKRWKRPKVVSKKDTKKFSFDLSLAKKSSGEFEIVEGGLKKDHCAICSWELLESDDAGHGIGFTNGRDWLCTECHQRFIARNFFASSYSDLT